jgi:hypothetical protein
VFELTAVVLMLKAGETLAPAAIITEAGTVAAGLLLASATVIPPDGAGAVSVTVALVGVPPLTEAEARFRAESATVPAGVSVRVALWVPL